MTIGDLVAGLGLIGLAFTGSCASGRLMENSSQQAQVRCSAAGAKVFVPAITPAAICARFSAAIRTAAAPGETLSVELKFLPNGVATAIVTRSRAGKSRPPVDFNLAISDRRIGLRDLDRLAADVVAGLRQNP
jgi:hypothetical protein